MDGGTVIFQTYMIIQRFQLLIFQHKYFYDYNYYFAFFYLNTFKSIYTETFQNNETLHFLHKWPTIMVCLVPNPINQTLL